MEKGKIRMVYACIIAFFVLAFVTFVLTPLMEDQRVFTASANIASYKGVNLFYDAYNTWELKGVFNRVLVYAMYNIATLFTDFGTFPFERAMKLIYACVILCFSLVSVILSCKHKTKTFRFFAFLLLSIIFLATGRGEAFQAEMSSTLFLVLGFALYINAEQSKHYETLKLLAAGLCIGITFFFKSATLIMSVAFVAAAYLWDVNHNYKPAFRKLLLLVAGSVIMLTIGIASILIINPDEIQDMLYASMFQHTLLNGGERSIFGIGHQFIDNYINASLFRIPFLIIGTIAFLLNLSVSIKNKRYDVTLVHLALWMVPALFVIISNKYFGYHYFTYISPSIIEIVLFAESAPRRIKTRIGICVMSVAALVAVSFYIGTLSALSPIFKAYITMTRKCYVQNERYAEMKFNEPILYLANGRTAYVLGADSYLKYFFPMPLTTLTDDSEYAEVKCRLDCLQKIEQYDGEYIVCQEYIFSDGKYAGIKGKIEREYEKIGEINIYSTTQKKFKCDSEEDFKYCDLFKRKSNL